MSTMRPSFISWLLLSTMISNLFAIVESEPSPKSAVPADTILESRLSDTDPETFSSSDVHDRNETKGRPFDHNTTHPINTTISEQDPVSMTYPHNLFHTKWNQLQGAMGTTSFSAPSVDQAYQQGQLQGTTRTIPFPAPPTVDQAYQQGQLQSTTRTIPFPAPPTVDQVYQQGQLQGTTRTIPFPAPPTVDQDYQQDQPQATARTSTIAPSTVDQDNWLGLDKAGANLKTFPKNALYLCDHLPRKFTPNFRGHPKEACIGQEAFEIYFDKTYELCNEIYLLSNSDSLISDTFTSSNSSQRVYYDDRYIKLCLPFYKIFNNCKENKFVAKCWEGDDAVLFVNPHTCPKPYNYRLFGTYISFYMDYEDITSLQLFCDGICTEVYEEVIGVPFKVSNLDLVIDGVPCRPLNFVAWEAERNITMFTIQNTHWPCCFVYHTVFWMADPEAHGLNGAWSYLPASCRAGEVMLILIVVGVAVSGVTGNLLVLVVMVSGSLRARESSMLRISLALADFLTAVFVVVPSFYEHISPFIRPAKLLAWRWDDVNASSNSSGNVSVGYYTIEGGSLLLQSYILCVCTTVSLLTMMLLSYERLVVTRSPLRYKHYFSIPWVLTAIAITWISGILNAPLFSYGSNGFNVQYSTLAKIPIGISLQYSDDRAITVLYFFHITLLILSIVLTIVFSTLAIVCFLKAQVRVKAEWKSLRMNVKGPINEENRYILITQLLILAFFLLSTFPRGAMFLYSMASQFCGVLCPYIDIIEYLSWWLFLAGSAWNPWIYNMRSSQFRDDTLARLLMLAPWRSRSP